MLWNPKGERNKVFLMPKYLRKKLLSSAPVVKEICSLLFGSILLYLILLMKTRFLQSSFKMLQQISCTCVSVVNAKSCSSICDPMDCSPPGFSVLGISEARILEWVAIFFSRGPSQSKRRTCVSCVSRRILFFFFF